MGAQPHRCQGGRGNIFSGGPSATAQGPFEIRRHRLLWIHARYTRPATPLSGTAEVATRQIETEPQPFLLPIAAHVPQHLRPSLPGDDLWRKPWERDRLRGRWLPALDPARRKRHPGFPRSAASTHLAL